jgi:hypothetical protein
VLAREGKGRVKDFRAAWRNLCVRAGLGEWFCHRCKQVMSEHRCSCRERRYRGLLVHDLRRCAAKALRAAGVPESVIMATGGWKTPAMFRRYAIVSSADNRAAVEALERARAEKYRQPRSAPFSENTPLQPQLPGGQRYSKVTGTAGVKWCPGSESNRYDSLESRDFKSRASASFATRAGKKVIENTISVELCELGSAAYRERVGYNFRPCGAGSK